MLTIGRDMPGMCESFEEDAGSVFKGATQTKIILNIHEQFWKLLLPEVFFLLVGKVKSICSIFILWIKNYLLCSLWSLLNAAWPLIGPISWHQTPTRRIAWKVLKTCETWIGLLNGQRSWMIHRWLQRLMQWLGWQFSWWKCRSYCMAYRCFMDVYP